MITRVLAINGKNVKISYTWDFTKKDFYCVDCIDKEKAGKVKVKIHAVELDGEIINRKRKIARETIKSLKKEMRHGIPFCMMHWIKSFGSPV